MFSVWNGVETAAAVNVTLYYESLCPGCKMFITEQLYPVYDQLKGIINITLVPYGNARVSI